MPADQPQRPPPFAPRHQTSFARLRIGLRRLFYGNSRAALRFQAAALTVDLAIIVLFIAHAHVRIESVDPTSANLHLRLSRC